MLVLARNEAIRLHQNYIGTEHLLLGLLKLGQGVAISVLQRMGLNFDDVRQAVENQIGQGAAEKPQANIPFTPRFK